ncbi:MAG TPA: LysM peptidoglycan-binding domain-containing protein [Anaerolineae bacterium]
MSNVRIALFFLGIILTIVAFIGIIDAQATATEGGIADFAYLAASSTPGPILEATSVLVEEPTATATATETTSEEQSPAATSVPPPSAFAAVAIIGAHVVQPGETLYCIGRAYAVRPQAITQANGLALNGILANRRTLLIPAVPWNQVPPGEVCAAQFSSSYVAAPTVTATPVAQSLPGATPTAQTGAPAAAPSPTATPVAETRKIVVYVPTGIALGESLEVILTFNPEAPAGAEGALPVATVATITSDSELLVAPQPLRDVYYFDEHRLFATARLDASGLMVSPSAEISYPVWPGEALVWRWSIKLLEAGPQTVILSLWLTYEPKRPDVEPLDDGLYWSAPFSVNARRTFLGLILDLQTFISMLGTVLGLVISSTQAMQLFGRRDTLDLPGE